jgi:hypothetical protein
MGDMSNIGIAKQIQKDVNRLPKGLNPDDQETVLKEAHNNKKQQKILKSYQF